MTYYYLIKDWRAINAPHAGYICDFDFVLANSWDLNDPYVAARTPEVLSNLMRYSINTCTDLIATITKKPVVVTPA
jgi:hypothetical protein